MVCEGEKGIRKLLCILDYYIYTILYILALIVWAIYMWLVLTVREIVDKVRRGR